MIKRFSIVAAAAIIAAAMTNVAGAQTTPANKTAEFKMKAGEVRLEGQVRAVRPVLKQIVLEVTAETQPNGTLNKLTYSRSNTVLVDDTTNLHVRGSRQKVALGDLKRGDSLVAIGQFSGPRQGWLARELAVWSRQEGETYSYGQPAAAVAPKVEEAPVVEEKPAPVPPDLVAWWSGEENSKENVKGLHGASRSQTHFGTGKVGSAFRFYGVEGGVSIPDNAAFAFDNSFTIEAWIYVESYQQRGMIVFRGDNRIGLDPYCLSVETNGKLTFHVASRNDAADLEVPVTLQQWQHVAAVLDYDAGYMRIYINGNIVAEQQADLLPMRDLEPREWPGLGIGNHPALWDVRYNYPFHGYVDELSLYKRALTPEEITAIFQAGSKGKEKVAKATQTGASVNTVDGGATAASP